MTILVSLPLYQTPDLIRRAVDSILGQTYTDLRLVVVNDGGTKPWGPLEDIADKRLVRFDLPKNRGRYYADAVTLAANPFDYYTIHDSDDWSESTRLEVLFMLCGGLDVSVDGWTRHGLNDQVARFKSRPELLAHRSGRSLWHIAHHKGLWNTEALRTIGIPAHLRVGWDTYLMHIAALTLKVSWVDYYGYHQQRRKNSLITSPLTGVTSRMRAAAIVELDRIWKAVEAEPERAAELVAPPADLQAQIRLDADRLLRLL